jgi:hypothetical protein
VIFLREIAINLEASYEQEAERLFQTLQAPKVGAILLDHG